LCSDQAWWLPAADAQWKWIDPGVFAVVGAAGFMGGVTRLTIALAAIMMEARPTAVNV
jgi:H+/Cl- antiporter ClcA